MIDLMQLEQDPNLGIDAQEMGEREELAQSDSGLVTEQHLVDYAYDCVDTSRQATKDIRTQWSELWRMSENEADFTGKEEWQSQISLDKPHATVQNAKAIAKNGM